MATKIEELEINYDVTFEDEKNTLLDILFNKRVTLYYTVIPIACILIFVIIMIIIGVFDIFHAV